MLPKREPSGKGRRKVKATAFPQRNGDLPFNASGVAQVAERRFVFIDNHVPTALFELEFDAGGHDVTRIRRRRMAGVAEEQLGDPEGLARIDVDRSGDGRIVLVAASSLCVTRGGQIRDGLVRIHYTPEGNLRAEPMAGFRDWLIGHDLLRARRVEKKPDAGGLNVEGLAWDRHAGALVLGLRGPALAERIRLIHIPVKAATAPWTTASLGTPSIVDVGVPDSVGLQGVRDIHYDEHTREYLILLGRALSKGDEPFLLGTWAPGRDAVQILDVRFHRSMKPEGITVFSVDETKRTLIVDDRGGYAVIDAVIDQ